MAWHGIFCLSFVLYKQIFHPYSFIIIRTPSYSMSSYVSCHILNYAMPCHHYLSLSLSLSCHHIHWLFLCHSWTTLTSMTTITQSFQQSTHLALMETSKHSPPLTTMIKDNLLCQCCTYFDIGFPVFLFYENIPYHHISPLWTEMCYLINVLSFILTLPFL